MTNSHNSKTVLKGLDLVRFVINLPPGFRSETVIRIKGSTELKPESKEKFTDPQHWFAVVGRDTKRIRFQS